MNKTEYQILNNRFRKILDCYAAHLSSEGRKSAEHFFEVAELEMSCESFVLSVIEDKVLLSYGHKKDLMALVKCLQLDKESVFRGDFWKVASVFFGDTSKVEMKADCHETYREPY